MDVDDDIVSTSPHSTSSIHGQLFRNQHLPPLPTLPGLVFESATVEDTASRTLQAQYVGSQRNVRANRITPTSRTISLQNWISPPRVHQGAEAHQAVVIDVVSSPRSDISVENDGNSSDDIVIYSDGDVVEIDEDTEDDEESNSGRESRERLPDSPSRIQDDELAIDQGPGNGPANISTDTTHTDTYRGSDSEAGISSADVVPSHTSISSSSVPIPSTLSTVTSGPVPSTSTLQASNAPEPSTALSVPTSNELVTIQNTSISISSAPAPSSLQASNVPVSSASLSAPLASALLPGTITTTETRLVQSHNDSLSEFRSPKRKRVLSPEKTETHGKAADTCQEEEEGESCPICFEPWTTTGIHRLCSLKCGHLFGQSCIDKWLRGQGGKCPHCNAKAKRQDIRLLFAKTIKALDTSERDRALKDLEKERELRRKLEMDVAQLRLQYQMSIEDTNKLRLQIETLKSQMRRNGQPSGAGNAGPAEPAAQKPQLSGQFVLEKTIKIFEGGNCRAMAYSNSLATLVISQPSSSQLFPGFGIKKISALDFKTAQYLTIHTKAIRDMAFHQTVEDGILLSCGLDKKVKMTSLISNAVVQSYDTMMPGWSCAWNGSDCNYFYAGLQNGLVLQFDIRNTGEPVQEFNKEGSRSPVASLVYVTANPQGEFRSSGLLIGQLDRVSFLENTTQGERIHILPLEGSLTSLNVDQQTRHLLASFRPTARHPTIRHQLCELTSTNISNNPTVINNVCSCNVVHTFHGGRKQTVLSKTLIQRHPVDQNRLLVCGGDETSNSVHIWDSGTGQLNQRLLADGMVVDLCKFSVNNQQYLTALTDKQCKVFKWK